MIKSLTTLGSESEILGGESSPPNSPRINTASNSAADQASGSSTSSGGNYIVPVTATACTEAADESKNKQMLVYAAGVNVRVICEESNVLWSQAELIINDQIGPLKRTWEGLQSQSSRSQPTNLSVNDEAEATLRRAITDSARQIGLINNELKKLSDMLKEWIPSSPGSADDHSKVS